MPRCRTGRKRQLTTMSRYGRKPRRVVSQPDPTELAEVLQRSGVSLYHAASTARAKAEGCGEDMGGLLRAGAESSDAAAQLMFAASRCILGLLEKQTKETQC